MIDDNISPFLSKQGQTVIELARLLLTRQPGQELERIHDYAARFGAGAGTVQAALRYIQEAGAPGNLAIAAGGVARQINTYARWADLTVVTLAHPPGEQPLEKLASGFRTLLRLSPGPVLAVPGQTSALRRALLAYDGSPRAEEALFLAVYLARHWDTALAAVVVSEDEPEAARLSQRVADYLARRSVAAAVDRKSGRPGPAIIAAAQEHQADLIIMGSC